MTDIVLIFEVHQPYRIERDFFWEHKMYRHRTREELFDYYFDKALNRDHFERASRKCYLPTNQILLNQIDRHKREKKRVKVAFSISGVFLEQCEKYNKDALASFKQLAETGCVEFLDQTYYHSLSSLYPVRDEFIEQVKMHRQAMRDLLHHEPTVFENTELLYNNAIAKVVEKLGYRGIFTEGAERILGGRSPNYVYAAKGCKRLRVLLRNYRLTDDVGFRFSMRWWSEWPLTPEKYARWLATTEGDCINIFPDYETFGEHHWPETGIHEFLALLPGEILKFEHLRMAIPSEVLNRYEPLGFIDVPEPDGTVSWADVERDAKSWLGNTMQWACYKTIRDMEPLIREAQNQDLLRVWRYLQVSDHLYYMFTAGGAPGEVHTYFNPFGNPVDAFVTFLSVLMDFGWRVRSYTHAANHPFKFRFGVGEEEHTGVSALSLRGFVSAMSKVDDASLEFHNRRRDFVKWARISLRDERLAKRLQRVAKDRLRGNDLRRAIGRLIEEHLGGKT
ncbi:MAG: alpha-amylase [Candidatus Bathyarchaeia archaeon]